MAQGLKLDGGEGSFLLYAQVPKVPYSCSGTPVPPLAREGTEGGEGGAGGAR